MNSTKFNQAIQFHQKGQLAEAASLYQSIVDSDPLHADAIHMLGLVRQQSGDHSGARELIEKAILINPSNPVYYSNLGSIWRRLKDHKKALQAFENAVRLRPDYPEALNNMANTLTDLGKHSEALPVYERAVQIKPNYTQAWTNWATTLIDLGRISDAKHVLDRALSSAPNDSKTWTLLGVTNRRLSKQGEALSCHARALALSPRSADAKLSQIETLLYFGEFDQALSKCELLMVEQPNLGHTFHLRGLIHQRRLRHDLAIIDFDLALALDGSIAGAYRHRGISRIEIGCPELAFEDFESAIRLEPHQPANYVKYGIAKLKSGDRHSAIDFFDKALALDSANLEARLQRANSLSEMGDLQSAEIDYLKAIAQAPNNSEVHFNYAFALQEAANFEAALTEYQQAIRCQPNHREAHNNLAAVLKTLNRVPESYAHFDRAIALGHGKARWNKAVALLLNGEMEEGWRLYEARWEAELGLFHTPFDEPLWLGDEPLEGKRILLHCEQGFGDTIQFCRYAPLVAALGAEVILEVPARLHRLATSLKGVSKIISCGDERPEFDYQTPLLSLPLAFKTTLASIPADTPYLSVPIDLISDWGQRIGERKNKVRVGIAWRGNAENKNDKFRSMSLRELEPIFNSKLEIISLQKDVTSAEKQLLAEYGVSDFSELQQDFSDAAAICAHADVILTVDTAIAHLSGALGLTTWIMLAKSADFRWLLDRNDSPWYRTARLFRQEKLQHWTSVITQVRHQLDCPKAS
jgi:tetratricopeptide (TPR) repeat protein